MLPAAASIRCLLLLLTIQFAAGQVNKTRVQALKAFFKPIGQVSLKSGYGHLYCSINVNQAVTQHNGISQALDATHLLALRRVRANNLVHHEMVLNATFMELHNKLRRSRERLSWVCLAIDCHEAFENSLFSKTVWKEPSKTTIRDRMRQHAVRGPKDLIDGALALASLGLSVYDLYEVHRLNRELIHEGNVIGHLAAELKTNSLQIKEDMQQIDSLRKQVEIMVNFTTNGQFRLDKQEALEYLDLFSSNLEAYALGLEDIVIRKQVNLRFFDLREVKLALENVKYRARKRGLKMLSESPADVLQEEISFLTQEGSISVFLHIPLREQNLANLYEHIPTPLMVSKGNYVQPIVEGKYFAVNSDNTQFAIFSPTTLQHCTSKNKLYLCDIMVTRRDPKTTCVGSLFEGQGKFISHMCVFQPWQIHGEEVVTIGPHSFITIVPNNHQVTADISCYLAESDKMSPKSPELLVGIEEVSLPPGCVFSSGSHTVRTAHDPEIQEEIVARPLNNLVNHFSKLTFKSKPMSNVLPKEFVKYAYPSNVDNKWDSSREDGIQWFWIGVMAFTILIILTVTVILVRRAQARRRRPQRSSRKHHRQQFDRSPDQLHGGLRGLRVLRLQQLVRGPRSHLPPHLRQQDPLTQLGDVNNVSADDLGSKPSLATVGNVDLHLHSPSNIQAKETYKEELEEMEETPTPEAPPHDNRESTDYRDREDEPMPGDDQHGNQCMDGDGQGASGRDEQDVGGRRHRLNLPSILNLPATQSIHVSSRSTSSGSGDLGDAGEGGEGLLRHHREGDPGEHPTG